MERYRKVLNVRIYALSFVVLLAIGLGIFDVFGATEQMKESVIFGFQSGAVTALGLLSLLLIVRFRKALKNEEQLKLLFNKENDERMKVIKSKAGMPIVLITSIAMLFAGVIAGYFNLIVFYTLLAASVSQLFVACIVKMVYMKKM